MEKKKSLGQHFLKSKTALKSMVESSATNQNDVIVEIGPGEGVLTSELLKIAGKVISIEKDHRLIPILEEKFKEEIKSGKLEILEKDILEFDPKILDSKYKVVANIPYYITGQILRMFLESDFQPESMTLLVQKEVAERIVARDGKENLLSLSVKVFGKPVLVRTVGKGAFSPSPNVDSAILYIKDISKENLKNLDSEMFFSVIHAGFAHKRKQLLPNLASLYSKEKLIETFKICDIDSRSRAEDISLLTWIRLCNIIVSW